MVIHAANLTHGVELPDLAAEVEAAGARRVRVRRVEVLLHVGAAALVHRAPLQLRLRRLGPEPGVSICKLQSQWIERSRIQSPVSHFLLIILFKYRPHLRFFSSVSDLLNRIRLRLSTRDTFRLTRASCLSNTSVSGISRPSRLAFRSLISPRVSASLLLFMSRIRFGSGVDDLWKYSYL